MNFGDGKNLGGVHTRWVKPAENFRSAYFSTDEFLKDMRAGTLREKFSLSVGVWNELVEMVNTNSQIAGEIADRSMLLLLAVDSGFELNGLIELAEACRGSDIRVATA